MRKQLAFKIAFLGDSDVGKTAIITRYLEKKFASVHISTMGIDSSSRTANYGDTQVTFNYWDTTGQERYRSVPQHYFRGADGIVLVFDLSNKDSFERIHYWYHQTKEHTKTEKIKFLLLGNKCDLEDKITVSTESINQLAVLLNSPYYETSAKDNINIRESFRYLEDQIVASREFRLCEQKTILYDELPKKRKLQCCN